MSEKTSVPALGGMCTVRTGQLKKRLGRLLNLPADEEELAALGLPVSGLTPEECDHTMLLAMAVYKKAVGGDIRFVQELREIIGDSETPLERRTALAELLA